MALSNILNEPRREITESIVGLIILCAFMAVDYAFGVWLENVAGHNDIPWPIGMILGIPATILLVAILFVTHAIGESVCNILQKNDIHLRPRDRKQQYKR